MVDIWKTPEERITRALADLQKAQPFFAHLAMGLKPQRSDITTSAAVDAKGRLYYNEDYIMKLSIDETMGLLCHEVLHVALIHMQRIGSRDHELSNLSQDVVVNQAVVTSGLRLPKDCAAVVDGYGDTAQIVFENQTLAKIKDVSKKNWEEIYDELQQNKGIQGAMGLGQGQGKPNGKQQGQGQPKGQGDGHGNQRRKWGFDDHIRGNVSEKEKRQAENEWKSRICDAANYAKQQGTLPAGMERMLDGILKPKVEWKSLLLRYLKAHFMPVDWSYNRPHKKSHALGVFLPNTLKEAVECEIYVDTSGSVSNKELKEFLTEIVAIAKSMPHITMWVTFLDTQVEESARYKVDNGDIATILNMKAIGGGGTDMEAGLDYCKQHNPTIPVALVFTDGYVPIRRKRSDYPFDVIWVVTPNGRKDDLTYGQVVQMDK